MDINGGDCRILERRSGLDGTYTWTWLDPFSLNENGVITERRNKWFGLFPQFPAHIFQKAIILLQNFLVLFMRMARPSKVTGNRSARTESEAFGGVTDLTYVCNVDVCMLFRNAHFATIQPRARQDLARTGRREDPLGRRQGALVLSAFLRWGKPQRT